MNAPAKPPKRSRSRKTSPAPKIPFTVRPSPLRTERITHQIDAGRSIIEILQETGVAAMPGHRLAVEVDGRVVPPIEWESFKPLAGCVMTAVQLPMGGGGQQSNGKNATRIVASIAIIAAAAYTGGAAVGLLGLTGTAATVASAVTTAAVAAAGNYALNEIFPPAGPGDTTRPNSVTGQRNEIRPFQPIPCVYGSVRMTPPLAAVPYTAPRGDDLVLHSLLTPGLGDVLISDVRVGETPVDQLAPDVIVQIRAGKDDDIFPSTFKRNIVELQVNARVDQGAPVVATTEPDITSFNVDVFFPEGVSKEKNRFRTENSVGGTLKGHLFLDVGHRVAGSGDPFTTLFPDSKTIIADDYNYPKRVNFRFDDLPSNQYEVRVTRITREGRKGKNENRMLFATLRSELTDVADNIPNLAYIAVRANVDGVVNGINALCEKRIDTFSGTPGDWSGFAVTSNPAAIARDILVGTRGNTARPVSDSDLKLSDFEDFYDYCETEGFTFNSVFEDFSTGRQRLATVLAAGRASLTRPNGLYGIHIDRPTAVPVAMISPRNSRGFSVSRVYEAPPQALRVRFIDQDDDFKPGERLVFDDGFNEGNITAAGTEVLDMTRSGQTTADIAYRTGRFEIAKRKLRVETYTVTQGLDHLVVNQGDLVKLQHDVLVVGLGAFRITSVSGAGGTVESCTVDGDIVMEAAKSYVARVRYVDDNGDDQLVSAPVDLDVGTGHELTFTTPFGSTSKPAVGDLLFFGESGLETIDAIVRDIRRIGNLEAELTLFDAAAGIHVADAGEIPAYNPQTTVPGRFSERPPAVPQIEGVHTRTVTNGASPSRTPAVNLYITIRRPPSSTQPPLGYLVRARLKDDDQFTIRQQFPGSSGLLEVTGLVPGKTYEFQVQATGNPGQLTAANSAFTATQEITIPIPATAPGDPDPVAGLELIGQGDNTIFKGRDAVFVWRYAGGGGVVAAPAATLVGATTLPSLTGFQDESFSHFEVTIRDTALNEVRRVENVTSPSYDYSFLKNQDDGRAFSRKQLTGGPARTFEIQVVSVNTFGQRSVARKLQVSNPPPESPLAIKVDDGSDHFSVRATRPNDDDIAEMLVWASSSSGFTPGPDNEVARVAGTAATVTVGTATKTFLRVAFADAFSSDPNQLNLSSELESNTLAEITNPPRFAFESLVFTPDINANRVSWGQAKVTTNNNGLITKKTIAAGSATFSGTPVYIYYQLGGSVLNRTTNTDVAAGTDRQIVAIYEGGANIASAGGDAFIDGSRVVAGTILAQAIGVGQIQADLLAADAVQAGKVAADAIGARELKVETLITDSAQVGDLTVAGRSLEEFAASNIVPFNQGGATAGEGDSNVFIEAIAASIESTGKPTLVMFNCRVRIDDVGDRSPRDYFVRFRPRRNGTQIKSTQRMFVGPGDRDAVTGYLVLADIDPSPPVGVNEYTVEVAWALGDDNFAQNAAGAGFVMDDRQLWLHEVKK